MIIVMGLICIQTGFSQNKPYRVGTTAANFLEVGLGSAGCAMGEAYVSVVRDLSSIYWNPAGLAQLNLNEIQVSYQPWIADIDIAFAGAGIVVPQLGTLGLAYYGMNFGRTDVTTLERPDGTGETYAASDYAISLSYARRIAQWFSFGSSVKYVASNIWQMSASAIAIDLGVLVNTDFFSTDGTKENGLSIGMSISNYGSRLRYDGMNLLQSIDIAPDENGNYKNVRGQFTLQSWELPLIFRVGISMIPVKTKNQMITLAVDALHPNNNSESINLGGEYKFIMPGSLTLALRGGYHGLFMDENQFGLTFGGGLHFALMNNRELKIDYAYKDVGILGYYSAFTLGATF